MAPSQREPHDFLDNDSWRNLVTGECRLGSPSPGELDWVKIARGDVCSGPS